MQQHSRNKRERKEPSFLSAMLVALVICFGGYISSFLYSLLLGIIPATASSTADYLTI
jgi:hypothetical protein